MTSPEEVPGFEAWAQLGPTTEPISDRQRNAAQVAAAVALAADTARIIVEAAAGHRAAMLEHGFCAEHAEHGAYHFHALIMARAFPT